jgi:octaprenyl-diphosphate synthase
MGDFFGVDHNDLLPFARVVELVHAATLAHDDVIDNASLRRGQASINAAVGNKRAVLAGDYLLAYAVDRVAQSKSPELVRALTRVISDLAEGEWLQLDNACKLEITMNDITDVALKKTGSVLRWCSVVPSILSAQPESNLEKAAQFGECLGIAFQMTDDILDFKRKDGSEFADLKSGVINSVMFQAAAIQAGCDTLSLSNFDEKTIKTLPIEKGIVAVAQLVGEKLSLCRQILNDLSDSPSIDKSIKTKAAHTSLNALISYLEARV